MAKETQTQLSQQEGQSWPLSCLPPPEVIYPCGWIFKNKHMPFPQWKVFFKKKKVSKTFPCRLPWPKRITKDKLSLLHRRTRFQVWGSTLSRFWLCWRLLQPLEPPSPVPLGGPGNPLWEYRLLLEEGCPNSPILGLFLFSGALFRQPEPLHLLTVSISVVPNTLRIDSTAFPTQTPHSGENTCLRSTSK